MANKRELHIEGLVSDVTYSNKTGKSLTCDLSKYNFDTNINIRANLIFNKMNMASRRANNRSSLLFFCVYNAHKELNMNVDVSELGAKFNLTQGQIQKTQSMFSFLKTGYKPTIRTISPLDYLADYCDKLNINEYTENILMYANNLLDKNTELLQLVPQTVAAGLIKYYLEINGIPLEENINLSTVTHRSDTTIDSMKKRIAELDG